MKYGRISLICLRRIIVIFVIAFGIIAATASGGGGGGSSDSDDDDDDEQEQVASPQFSLAEGRYYNEQTITITCATEGAAISYTTDNTDPSETEGTTMASGESFALSSTGTVKAIAYKTGMSDSEITSADYLFPLWTWVSGDSVANRPVVYGTQGEGDAANKPGARDSSISWIDSSGTLWLFGGSGYAVSGVNNGRLNDLWMFAPETGIWTWVSGDDTVNQPGVYGTQGTGDVSNKPGARDYSVSWIDSSGNLWLFGGYGYVASDSSGRLNDLWMFDPETGIWTWVSGNSAVDQSGVYGIKGEGDAANRPGARSAGVSWIDSSGDLWLFGGQGYDASGSLGKLNDLWMFDTATKIWTWISGNSAVDQSGVYGIKGREDISNKPGARAGSVSWMDSSGDLWLFGGLGYDSQPEMGCLNDLWRFDPSTEEWTWISGDDTAEQPGVYGTQGEGDAANKPRASVGSVSWMDSSGDLWLFGGLGYTISIDGLLNDLWRFNTSTGIWTWISGDYGANQPGVYGTQGEGDAANKPGARYGSVSWIDSSGDLWLFGGGGYDASGNSGELNDLWKF